MIQTERKVLPDKPGIYAVSVLGQVYGVLFVIMHEGLQYRFANYLERNPEFHPFDPKDQKNEWDDFWLLGDEPTGILNNAEEAKRVLDRAVDGSVKHEVHKVTEWYDEKIALGETPSFAPSRFHEDDLIGSATVSGTLNVEGATWEPLKLEPQTEWFDIPTEPGLYLATYEMSDKTSIEYIVEIIGETPFCRINVWEVGCGAVHLQIHPNRLRNGFGIKSYKKISESKMDRTE